jgi:hypothetical protein
MRLIMRWLILIFVLLGYGYASIRFFGYLCPSESLLGLPCPGCGLTRAALLLLSGRISDSLAMNPMLFLVFGYIVIVILEYIINKPSYTNHALELLKRMLLLSRSSNFLSNIYLIVALVSTLLYFVYRLIFAFGEEPIVLNNRALFFELTHSFLRFIKTAVLAAI